MRRTFPVRPAVLGGVDGIISSFAVLAGGDNSSASRSVLVGIAVASLAADALSMGVSEYLSARGDASPPRKGGTTEDANQLARTWKLSPAQSKSFTHLVSTSTSFRTHVLGTDAAAAPWYTRAWVVGWCVLCPSLSTEAWSCSHTQPVVGPSVSPRGWEVSHSPFSGAGGAFHRWCEYTTGARANRGDGGHGVGRGRVAYAVGLVW